LDTYTNDLEEEITGLGLKYNLLTQYTSFVAIDNQVRNQDGTYTTVSQPLPLPQGVSNYAIGGVAGYNMQKSSSRMSLYMGDGGSLDAMACKEIAYSIDKPDEEEKDDVLSLVEDLAEFEGDKDGIEAFLLKNMIYPSAALSDGIDGYVYVEFVIDTDGSISEVRVISSTDGVFDQEAIRLINLTNKKWKPSRQSGSKVKSRMILEVAFEQKK